MSDNQNQFTGLWADLKESFRLNVDYAKLTAAEKLTMLFTTVTFAVIGFALASIILLFLSMAIVSIIAKGIGLFWAYMIVSGFYVVVLALILAFRKQLIVNPISRFVTRLFFNP